MKGNAQRLLCFVLLSGASALGGCPYFYAEPAGSLEDDDSTEAPTPDPFGDDDGPVNGDGNDWFSIQANHCPDQVRMRLSWLDGRTDLDLTAYQDLELGEPILSSWGWQPQVEAVEEVEGTALSPFLVLVHCWSGEPVDYSLELTWIPGGDGDGDSAEGDDDSALPPDDLGCADGSEDVPELEPNGNPLASEIQAITVVTGSITITGHLDVCWTTDY